MLSLLGKQTGRTVLRRILLCSILLLVTPMLWMMIRCSVRGTVRGTFGIHIALVLEANVVSKQSR